jgi:hypothetical protein
MLFEHGTSVSRAQTPNSGYSFNLEPQFVRIFLFPIKPKYRPPLIVVIDNHRVLHGRSSFDGKRRMCGAYFGVDEYRSKLAVLTENFAPDLVLQATSGLSNPVVNGRSVWNNAL